MEEKILAHIVSIWRESTKFLTVGGREGMLVLTDRRLAFIHKTEAKMRWWGAVVARQGVLLHRKNDIMIRHDGYDEKEFEEDITNEKNVSLAFGEIQKIESREEVWGGALYLEYAKNGKREKYRFSVAQDWVKYPMKEPTKFMKVDWEPLVRFVKERQVAQ